MDVMADRESRRGLAGRVEMDDTSLGGEHSGGKVERGSGNKVPFVAAVQAHDQGHPLFVRFDPVAANFRWVNTLLGNLKRALSGTYPAFNFAKYARRDLAQ
jgi:hypothetical protein